MATAGLTLSVAACGGGLKGDDPQGYAACSSLEKFNSDGEVSIEENAALGISASAATTKAIRESAKATFDKDTLATLRQANPKVDQIYLVDREALRTGCAAAGYKFKS